MNFQHIMYTIEPLVGTNSERLASQMVRSACIFVALPV